MIEYKGIREWSVFDGWMSEWDDGLSNEWRDVRAHLIHTVLWIYAKCDNYSGWWTTNSSLLMYSQPLEVIHVWIYVYLDDHKIL